MKGCVSVCDLVTVEFMRAPRSRDGLRFSLRFVAPSFCEGSCPVCDLMTVEFTGAPRSMKGCVSVCDSASRPW